ncbi:MAG: SufD family Fe-S cluster assembly protein [Bacilli bacterium]|nr:SufD family Fe-S cluster assembly protein [Bacilli bacterium]
MNKIKIENDIVVKKELNKKVRLSFLEKTEDFMVNKLVIDLLEDTTLEIEYHNETAQKLDILIRVYERVEAKILEIRNGNLMKIQYRYELDNDSVLNVQKFHHMNGIKELDNIYLNGKNSKIDYTLKTISRAREKYDITVYHEGKNTESMIRTNGVNLLDGSLDFHITGFVPNGKSGAKLDQKNRIINLNNQKCSIHPNLFIDEYDVIANHSAWIGKFREEELFYLESRGLTESLATNLLVKGFLLSNLELSNKRKEEFVSIINQYWR